MKAKSAAAKMSPVPKPTVKNQAAILDVWYFSDSQLLNKLDINRAMKPRIKIITIWRSV